MQLANAIDINSRLDENSGTGGGSKKLWQRGFFGLSMQSTLTRQRWRGLAMKIAK